MYVIHNCKVRCCEIWLPAAQVYLTGNHLAITMELASGSDLAANIRRVGRFPEPVALYFFRQLISAVAWCHSKVRAELYGSTVDGGSFVASYLQNERPCMSPSQD